MGDDGRAHGIFLKQHDAFRANFLIHSHRQSFHCVRGTLEVTSPYLRKQITAPHTILPTD